MIRSRSRIVTAAFALAMAAFLGCSRSGTSVKAAEDGAGLRPVAQRKSAPEFDLKDSDGRVVRLADYKGKVVLLNFWATWCGPCKIEIPWFIEFERRYKDKGFAVLGVSMDEEGWSVVKPFVADFAVNYRILLGNDQIGQLYGGVEALPTTFLIDRDGKVASTHIGLAGKGDFEDGIKELLNSKSAALAGPGDFSARFRPVAGGR